MWYIKWPAFAVCYILVSFKSWIRHKWRRNMSDRYKTATLHMCRRYICRCHGWTVFKPTAFLISAVRLKRKAWIPYYLCRDIWPYLCSFGLPCELLSKTNWINFRVCKSLHHHTFNWINQPDAATSQVYYLSFKYSSTCFGHPHAHHQELQLQ